MGTRERHGPEIDHPDGGEYCESVELAMIHSYRVIGWNNAENRDEQHIFKAYDSHHAEHLWDLMRRQHLAFRNGEFEPILGPARRIEPVDEE